VAVFRYRMQNILNVKFQLEEQARMDFGQAVQRLNEEEEKLVALYDRKASYQDKAKELLNSALDILEISANKEAIIRMEEYILRQKERIEEAKQLVEAARRKLTEAIQERKIHEKLKEKAFEEFLQEENRKEKKEIDELTSYTYGQKLVQQNQMMEIQNG